MKVSDERTDRLSLELERGGARGPAEPGLVLLHAPQPRPLPSAVLLRAGLILGRGREDHQLTLPFPSVSRRHACIDLREGRWWIVDLGGRNGTLVDGRAVSSAPLTAGAVVRIGDVFFEYVEDEASAYLDHPIDRPASPTIDVGVGGLAIARLRARIATLAPTRMPTLVLGESGTGKELVARSLHETSGRSGPLCAVNCAALPAGLVESELFGHARGAFTSATGDRVGVVRRAHLGTLFLDEIGDLPLDAQAKLLRVLESGEVTPVGADRGTRVDVRLVAATHRDLHAMARRDAFRGDLLARIAGATVRLPPLRARRPDICALVRWLAGVTGDAELAATPAFFAALFQYDWPFNVRELAAAVRFATLVSAGAPLTPAHLPAEVQASLRGYGEPATDSGQVRALEGAIPRRMRAPSRGVLEELLVAHRGNVTAVARALQRQPNQIRRWLTQHDLSANDHRDEVPVRTRSLHASVETVSADSRDA